MTYAHARPTVDPNETWSGTDEACATCRFWLAGNAGGRHREDAGCCHRHAPRPSKGQFEFEVMKHLTTLSWQVATVQQKDADFNDWEDPIGCGDTHWPKTGAIDWCGEYERQQ